MQACHSYKPCIAAMPYRVFLLVYLKLMVLGTYFEGFMAYLRFEKRLSSHTLTAYSTDLAQFATFITETYGELPGPASVSRHHPPLLAGRTEERRWPTNERHHP